VTGDAATGDMVRRAAAAAAELFDRVPDPAARVPTVDDDVAGVAAHITSCLLWYAQDLVAGPVETDGFRLSPPPDADLGHMVRQLRAAAEVLARTLDAAKPDDRGWHPWGIADASGFAGMACAELVIHTGDVAADVGLPWEAPADVADAVLARLFPWAPADGNPEETLRWATGRVALPGHETITSWRWHCAPLAEWDGRRPQ
jgi:hypothetical protein